MSFERRLEDVERHIEPHPHAVAVVYRDETPEGEDTPTTLTDEESELYHRLLAEALESNPDAAGYTLYLDLQNPRWAVWEP